MSRGISFLTPKNLMFSKIPNCFAFNSIEILNGPSPTRIATKFESLLKFALKLLG